MDKRYKPAEFESKIYRQWEDSGAFAPNEKSKAEPYTIVLPPPNANANLHAGHVMYVIEDILIRRARMQGKRALWIPGADHAGFETQYVYENHLQKKGKSRTDFSREQLYKDIMEFVQTNRQAMYEQLKKLGFSLDWTREKFTLDPDVIKLVYSTFEKMHREGLIYRDSYMVNYCPFYKTTFSDLEVTYIEKSDPLYYIKYGPFVLATVRPETKFGDTAIAVHPQDKRYKKLIGKEIEAQGLLGKFKLKVIADKLVDPEFGTGAVKVTPAHDPNDFDMGKRHNLEFKTVIDLNWKLTKLCGSYAGLRVDVGRKKVVQDLQKAGLLEKVDDHYTHRIAVSYKGNHPIEPTIMPNWFVNTAKLAKPALQAVKTGQVKLIPKRFEKIYYHWMKNIRNWPISRQIVWGIRIPAWYNANENPDLLITFLHKKGGAVQGALGDLLKDYSLKDIQKGLQTLIAPNQAKYVIGAKSPGDNYLQETDTFDTWYSSGQWPLAVTGYPNSSDFKTYYPTAVLDTMWDILFFWVARMIMFGLYLTGRPPFKTVYLHSMVTDEKGQKMSKSKGNVVDPLSLSQQYGTDALRLSLVVGAAPGNPIALSEEKIRGNRNFCNKLWNAARFIVMGLENDSDSKTKQIKLEESDRKILKSLDTLIQKTSQRLDTFRLGLALEEVIQSFWSNFCDHYLESTKNRLYGNDALSKRTAQWTLLASLQIYLQLLHPFIPFITEKLWQDLAPFFKDFGLENRNLLILSSWPTHTPPAPKKYALKSQPK